MRVIIVRHGKAEQVSPTGRDEDRRLKSRGERQARFVGDASAADGRRPGLIITSRFERAFATARFIQGATGSPLHTAPELEGEKPVSAAVTLLQRQTADPLMLVGHNPQLAQLISVLTR